MIDVRGNAIFPNLAVLPCQRRARATCLADVVSSSCGQEMRNEYSSLFKSWTLSQTSILGIWLAAAFASTGHARNIGLRIPNFEQLIKKLRVNVKGPKRCGHQFEGATVQVLTIGRVKSIPTSCRS